MSDLDNKFERGDTLGVEVVMRRILSLAVMCSLAFPAMALAEEPEAPKEAADDLAAEYGEEAAEWTEKSPPKEAEMKMPEPPKMAMDDLEAQGEPEEDGSWKDGLSWQILASAFYRLGGYAGDGVLAGSYNNLLDAEGRQGYPYTNYNGFGLNFAGGDVMYTGEKFAVRLDLRFGTGAPLLTPAAPVKQAYAAWMPTEKLNFDLGFFDTIFGAEVVDEWNNANYTRGALYFLRQPFNHMGLRMGLELTEIVGMTLMVTNGGVYGGTVIDDNETPALSWQLGFTPDGHNSVRRRGLRDGYRGVGLFVGGSYAASGNDGNQDWVQFYDVVFSMDLKWAHIIFNGDYYINGSETSVDTGATGTEFTYGHSLALIFDASDHWSIGLRGEHLSGNAYYRDETGPDFGGLATGTITLRYKPVEYLVISMEGRGEWSTSDIYFSRSATDTDGDGILIPNQKKNYAAILGVTAHIGN
jgi:hypothetical protein